MATTMRPVLCPHCGAQVRKNGYCSECYLPLSMLKKAQNTSNYYYNIGYDRASARDLSGAIESLLQALRYNKRNVQARNLLGLIYYEMGEAVQAMAEWVMSINYQPENNLAAKYLKELKKDPARLESVDQLARKFNMAIQYAHSEDYDLAILQLKSALSDNPHFVKGYLLLALLYIGTDNYEKARVTLRRVLKIDKANSLAVHYLREMGDTEEDREEKCISGDQGKEGYECCSDRSVRTGQPGEVFGIVYAAWTGVRCAFVLFLYFTGTEKEASSGE